MFALSYGREHRRERDGSSVHLKADDATEWFLQHLQLKGAIYFGVKKRFGYCKNNKANNSHHHQAASCIKEENTSHLRALYKCFTGWLIKVEL